MMTTSFWSYHFEQFDREFLATFFLILSFLSSQAARGRALPKCPIIFEETMRRILQLLELLAILKDRKVGKIRNLGIFKRWKD